LGYFDLYFEETALPAQWLTEMQQFGQYIGRKNDMNTLAFLTATTALTSQKIRYSFIFLFLNRDNPFLACPAMSHAASHQTQSPFDREKASRLPHKSNTPTPAQRKTAPLPAAHTRPSAAAKPPQFHPAGAQAQG
jgi:hypothetical protein